MDTAQAVPDRLLARALGVELRRARENRGWSRLFLVRRLPSGIGERTVLSYEHGARQLTLVRFAELCQELGVSAPELFQRALQAARINLATTALRVDLRELLSDTSPRFQPLMPWARNRINAHPEGVADLAPVAVRELALFLGCTLPELMNYLARFAPDPIHEVEFASA